MTEQRERYDQVAEGYARWWAPVLAPMARALLDEADADVQAGARRILDLGTGTGTAALAALRRWPPVRVLGVDASDGMLALAARASDELGPTHRQRLELRQGFADALPVEDASMDVVLSSFVLQLVPSRSAALREAARVLRPGGLLAFVTWLRGGEPFAGDSAFDAALDAVGIGAREPEGGVLQTRGDLVSVPATVRALHRTGFRQVRAREATVRHVFTPEGYLRFMSEFDEEDLFASLSARERAELEHEILARLDGLQPDELELRMPVVIATGHRRS
jgi:ubiquinone/menaquinone biosynthesis C-methylase UbiE